MLQLLCFNFEIPVITVFSRGTEDSRKQVFARARVCVCVCVCGWERAVNADLKVEAGLKLKMMIEHTRMSARHSRTPNTHARTHVLTPRTNFTHTTYAS